MIKAALTPILAGLAFTMSFAASASEEPLIEILPELERACTEAVVKRTLVLLEAAEEVGDKHDAGIEQRHEARMTIKARSQELVSAVGAITASALYVNPSLPSVSKASVLALRSACEAMVEEVPAFEQEMTLALKEETYLAHTADNADIASHVSTLEQFVLVKKQQSLPANFRFEELLSRFLPIDEIEHQIKKLKEQL